MAEIKNIYAWIGPDNGYAAIYWQADGSQDYDWVGLYADEQKEQNDYDSWQWVSEDSSYVTSTIISDKLNVRYLTWDEKSGSYKELMSTTGLNIEDEVNADGESQLQPGCWVTCSNSGYAVLHWTPAKSPQGSEDWVALYQDVNKSNDHFISGSWHWALNESSYVTSVAFSPGLQARYIKEGSPYIALRRSKPIAKGYLDLEKIYTSTESDPKKIMIDQLSNAVNGKRPSVFSEGMWPFPKELPYKVLSYEEVKVISRFLEPQSYDDVITIYYETYKTALKTDDAGERNAKRHAVWQISMMYKFGEHFAREIGAAHEKGRPGTKEDRRVNGLNNAAAIKYAKEHPGIDPLEAADEMWKKGLLIGYNDGERPEHTKDEW